MKFITDFLNSGTVEQQNRKKLGALVICITAALLVVALIVLAVFGIAGAIKNKNQEDEGETGPQIPKGYVTTTIDPATVQQTLFVIDEAHPYTGTAQLVDFPSKGSSDRAQTESGGAVYSGASGKKATAEAVTAFNKMMQAFYDAKKDDCLYIRSIDASGTIFTFTYYADFENEPDNRPSIYNSEAKAPVATYKWIYDNAAEYGFVRASDAEGEENVFRYVGAVHAKIMADKKLNTVAAYITYLQTKTNVRAQVGATVRGADGKDVKYSVYFIAADETPYVPEAGTYEYTVCSDNMGGYIVTVCKTKITTKTEATPA